MMIVFGGAFNPVTNAHLAVCDFVLDRHPDATFLFLPVSSAYTKSHLASNHDRLEMLRLAIGDRPRVAVSDLEISDTEFLGTYRSLVRISDAYQEEVAFVIGADNLVTMHRWINIRGLLAEFRVIVLGRSGINIVNLLERDPVLREFRNRFDIHPDFDIDISSTGFRQSFDPDMVPKAVLEYIRDHELYRGEHNA
jgi:nicotinate-nucleotide adenylyltransferase